MVMSLICGHVTIAYGDEEQCNHSHQLLQAKVLLYGREQRQVSKQNISRTYKERYLNMHCTAYILCKHQSHYTMACHRLSRVRGGRVEVVDFRGSTNPG